MTPTSITINNATLTLKNSTTFARGHTQHLLQLKSGAWPTDATLLEHFGAFGCGGHVTPTMNDGEKVVDIWGCD